MTICHIYDLDQTIVNSDHRTKPAQCPLSGDLDLNHYRKLATHENIMRDQLLPLANLMRDQLAGGDIVVVVTSRMTTKSDHIFLRKHGLRPLMLCSRANCHKAAEYAGISAHDMVKLRCGDFKRHWFNYLRHHTNFSHCTNFVVYDDHRGVLHEAAQLNNFFAVDALALNKSLQNSYHATAHKIDRWFNLLGDDAEESEQYYYQAGIDRGYMQALIDNGLLEQTFHPFPVDMVKVAC